MTRPATIRARRPSGMLDLYYADHAEARDGFIVAVGRWRGSRRSGQHAWPASRVVEVVWRDEAVVA
jgi:hypothetical protein